MSTALYTVLAVATKDIKTAGRTRDVLLVTGFFAGLVLFILGLALHDDARSTAQTAAVAAGATWTALALAAANHTQRAFSQEQENAALQQLLLYPGPHGAVYLGKVLGALGPLLTVTAGVLPGSLLLYGALQHPLPWAALGLTGFLGIVGFTAVMMFYSAMIVQIRAREALLPVLTFPIIVPVIIASVKATSLLLVYGWSSEVYAWLGFLGMFDLMTLIVATLLFVFVTEGHLVQ